MRNDHDVQVASADAVIDAELAATMARSGRTADLLALIGGAVDVVDHKGDSLLMLAAYNGHADTLTALLARGADATTRGTRGLSPLDGAAFKGDIAVVEALVASGVDVDDRGPDGRTALMWAAAFNRVAMVDRLIALGANVAAVDAAGRAAVDHAEGMGAVDVAAKLRKR